MNVRRDGYTDTVEFRSAAALERDARQLDRLARIVDVLYALALFRTITVLPHPTVAQVQEAGSVLGAMRADLPDFMLVILGVALVAVFWGANNMMFGNLVRTDARHALSSIVQTMGVMMFGYTLRLSNELGDLPQILAAQSVILLIAGAMAAMAWSRARRTGMISDAVTEEEKQQVARKLLTEPILAVLTIPLAWVGPMIYTISWFVGFPAVDRVLRATGR
jgi:uncharacterized membrane protein